MSSQAFRSVLLSCFAATVCFGCAKSGNTREQRLAQANQYFVDQQYAKAETEYREVLRLAPKDPTAIVHLGKVYFQQGRYRQAYPFLKQAVDIEPNDVDLRVEFGQVSLSVGQLEEARKAALQVLEKQPAQEQALMLWADTLRPPDLPESRMKVAQWLQQDKDRPGYHLALGSFALRDKQVAVAEAEFRAALALDPKSGIANAQLGAIYWSRNDLPAAEREFKAAYDMSPARSPMRFKYVDFKLATKAFGEARTLLDDISQKAPEFLPPQVYLLKIDCMEGATDSCARRAQSILAQDPTNYDGIFQDGLWNLTKGDETKSIRQFEFLANSYPKNFVVRYHLARAYLALAQKISGPGAKDAVESAERRLAEAVQFNENYHEAVLLLAEIKIRKGSPASAVDLLVKVADVRPPIAQAHYLLATAYLAQQQRSRAQGVYEQMLELFPKDPQPAFLLGRVLLQQRLLAEARVAFEKSSEISESYLPATEVLIDLDLADKNYTAALSRIQVFLDKTPNKAQALAVRGKVNFAKGDLSQAETDLLEAMALDPKLEVAYLLLAQLYDTSKRPDQAIEKLKTLVERSNSVPALMHLGSINLQQKRFEAARDAYEAVIRVAPNSATALNNLALIYSDNLGQLDKAIELGKRAKDAAPNDPRITDTLGWLLYQKFDYDKALIGLIDAAGKLPSDPDVLYHLGMTYYMLGQEADAAATLQKAVDTGADFAGKDNARRRLGLLAIGTNTANAALRGELDSYLRDTPNDPVALFRLAKLQELTASADEANKTYEKLVEKNPLFSPAWRPLAMLYSQRTAELPKAYNLALKAREASRSDPETADTLGWILYKRNEFDKAMPLALEASSGLPGRPDVQFHLAMTYYMLGQEQQARSAFQKAVDANLDFREKDEARQRLALLDVQSTNAGARGAIENYLRVSPNDPVALFRLAKLQEQSGASDEAKKTYENLVSKNPQFAPGLRGLAIYYGQGTADLTKTYELAFKASQSYPDDSELTKVMGIISYRRGNLPQAMGELKAAAGKRNDDAEVIYYLGQVYRQLGQRGDCKETLQSALNLKLPSSLVDEAKRALAACS